MEGQRKALIHKEGYINGMEEHALTDGEKQESGPLAHEDKCLNNNFKPMVEVANGQAIRTCPTVDKLRDISNRIKNAYFGRIPARGKGGMDIANDSMEEVEEGQLSGRREDGQHTSSKIEIENEADGSMEVERC